VAGRNCRSRVACGGASVDALAEPGRHHVERRRHVTAEHYHARIEDVDRDGQHLAEAASAVAEQAAGKWVAGEGEGDRVADVGGVAALLDQALDQRPAASDRLQASIFPAPLAPRTEVPVA
jgi:hypothetical protein